jgi:hydroxymethylpyrimidine kinase/phosphomethylpyrimidine kinase
MMTIARALSIAGSAAQGSAGIQADLKTFQECDVYGMCAITAIVANNPITEQGIFINSIESVEAQYYAAFEHVGIDALKTGMLFSKEIIDQVVTLLEKTAVKNIVVDPVMIGKMGSQLLKDDAIDTMIKRLFPLATIITPNLQEAARLVKKEVRTVDQMKEAAKELHGLGSSFVLIKGGSLEGAAIDILYDGSSITLLEEERVDTIHTSGAGCTYSATITAEIAKGKSVAEAVAIGKDFITAAIESSLSFNRGIGSTNHAAYRKSSMKG